MSATTRRILTWLIAGILAVLSALVSWTPASAAPAPTKQLTVDFYHAHITLTVPSGWHRSHTRPTASCGCGGAYRPV